MSNVEQVIEAATRGDYAAALNGALKTWRAAPAACIADAIDALDAEAATRFRMPNPRAKAAFQRKWLEVADEGPDPLGTGWLARNLTRRLPIEGDYFGVLSESYVLEAYSALFARLAALKPHGPDPRIARALKAIIVQAPFAVWGERSAEALYGAILELLVEQRDVRQAEDLARLLAAPRAKSAIVRQFLDASLARIIVLLDQEPAVEPPDAPEWARLDPDRTPPESSETEAALLESIFRAPEDLESRLVYADLLQTRDDPRGEFIALQMLDESELTKHIRSRIGSLWRRHKAEWLGDDLDTVLVRVAFERGFLARAALAQNAVATPDTWRRAAQDPRLATVHWLEKGRCNAHWYTEFVTSPAMVGLKRVEIPNWTTLQALVEGPQDRLLSHLELHRAPRPKQLQVIDEVPAFQHVDTLTVTTDEGAVDRLIDHLLGSPLAARIRSLTLQVMSWHPETIVAELFRAWPRLPASLRHFACHDWVGLRRTDRGLVAYASSHAFNRFVDVWPRLPDSTIELVITDRETGVEQAAKRLRAARPALKVETGRRSDERPH